MSNILIKKSNVFGESVHATTRTEVTEQQTEPESTLNTEIIRDRIIDFKASDEPSTQDQKDALIQRFQGSR